MTLNIDSRFLYKEHRDNFFIPVKGNDLAFFINSFSIGSGAETLLHIHSQASKYFLLIFSQITAVRHW